MRVFELASSFKVSKTSCQILALGVALVTAAGCGEDPPPPPAGAFNLQFTAGADPSKCRIMTHQALFGGVAAGGNPATIADGANGSSVSCTIQKSGSNFGLQVRATSNGYNFAANVKDFPASATPDAPAQGTVTYTSPQTQDNFVGSPCSFWILPDEGQYIKDGSAWFTFSCVELTSEGRTCSMPVSFAKFDNCTVAEEE